MKTITDTPIVHDISTPAVDPVVEPAELQEHKTLIDVQDLDWIILVDALDPIRKAAAANVKALMAAKEAKRAEGPQYGMATLGDSSVQRIVDVGKFIAKCRKAKIGMERIHAALSVGKGAAEELLGKDTVAGISGDGKTTDGKLTPKLRPGVALTPAMAAAELAVRLKS